MFKNQVAKPLFSIEVLRGIAVILVLFLHGREVAWVGTKTFFLTNSLFSLPAILALLSQPFVFGSIGVPIFFVLSGYCIHRKAAFNIVKDPANSNNYPKALNFLFRRFIRIYPVLLGALVVTYFLDKASFTYHPVNYKLLPLTINSFLINVFALQGVLGPAFGSNGALWSLSLEIQFYLCYPFLILVRKKIGVNKTLLLILLINIFSLLILKKITFFTSYYFSWYLGFYIAEVRAATLFKSLSKRLVLYAGIFLILFGCVLFFTHIEFLPFNCWSLGFALYLWYLLDKEYPVNLLTKTFSFVGDMSYSLYAIHLPIFVFFMSYFYNSVKPVNISVSILFSIIIVFIAYIFYMIIEKPTIKLLSAIRMRNQILTKKRISQ